MEEEIKEILKLLNDDEYNYISLDRESCKLLLEYITNLQEENKEAHDFDETMKDINDNLIARINRQECKIHNLKAKLEMYENGVYFSSENDELQQRIDKAIEYMNSTFTISSIKDMIEIFDKIEFILKGSDKE